MELERPEGRHEVDLVGCGIRRQDVPSLHRGVDRGPDHEREPGDQQHADGLQDGSHRWHSPYGRAVFPDPASMHPMAPRVECRTAARRDARRLAVSFAHVPVPARRAHAADRGADRPGRVRRLGGRGNGGDQRARRSSSDERQPVATFDPDQLFDYRSRRPTLEIRDGRLSSLAWPEVTLRLARFGGRDLLVLTGAEPDDRWRRLGRRRRGAPPASSATRGWISLGAIPAAVPHTRPVPILGTESEAGLLRGGVIAGPTGILRVPSAALSMLEMAVSDAGIPAVGYFAQIPHYVAGPVRARLGGAAAGRGAAPRRGAAARRPRRARRASCASGWTPRPRPTRRPASTSSGSRRWSTSRGCPRATT